MPQLSICIPAYEMGGDGATFLAHSLGVMTRQSFDDFEVIVSDQSGDDAVEHVCASFPTLSLRHLRFADGPRQASANTNNAIRHARGDILKILFQDDLLHGTEALAKTVRAFDDPAVAWMVCGSGVTRDGQTNERSLIPQMNPVIQFGRNTVSSPSVLSMRRDQALPFDEALIWLMDVDLYKRLELRHGPPAVVEDVLVWNRLHGGQVSESVSPALRRKELAYIREKFRSTETLAGRLAYYRQMIKAR